MDFNANWLYRLRGGEDTDTRDEFQQRYNLGVGLGPSLTYRPTPAISATAAVGYSRSQQSQGHGSITNEELIPSAQVSLVNDIFLAQVSGSTTTTTSNHNSGSDTSSDSWDTTLASNWVIPLWPSLRLNCGERTDTEGERNSHLKHKSISLNWDLILAKIYYLYNNNQTEDLNSNSLTKSDSHFVRLESVGSFWNSRLSYNFAQQVQYVRQDLTLDSHGLGNNAFNLSLDGQRLATVGTNPATGPEDVILEGNSQLGDDIYDVPALDVAPGQDVNLGVRFQFKQPIDILRLTFDPLTTLTQSQAAALQWDLYVRNPFDTGWELAAEKIPALYDPVEKHLDLLINRNAAKIMVVAHNPIDSAPLDITELEAFSQHTENFNGNRLNYLTNFGMGARLAQNWYTSVNLTKDHSQNDFGGSSSDDDHQTVSGNLRWTPAPYLSEALGFSESKETQTGELDQVNRSYSLTMSTIPLPTMNAIFNVTRNEGYQGEQKISSSNRYGLTSTALIYPDLNAALFLYYTDGVSMDSEGFLAGRTSFGSRLDLNARLERRLTADLTANYFSAESETESNQSTDATLNVQYRPSDLLALRGAYTAYLGGQGTNQLVLGLRVGLMRTDKIRLDANLSHAQADTSSDNFNLDGTWEISKSLLLQSRANYSIGTQSVYTFQAFLTLKL